VAAPDIPDTFPPYLVAGTTWQWTQKLYDQFTGDEFAADDAGVATIYFAGRYSIEIVATAQASTDDWLFSLAASGSGAYTDDVLAGLYAWRIVGVLSGKTYDLGVGQITVYANPDVAIGTDQRTHDAKMVPLLEGELEARITGDGSGHSAYAILGRSIEKIPTLELEAMLARYKFRLQQARYGRPRPLKTYFKLPS